MMSSKISKDNTERTFIKSLKIRKKDYHPWKIFREIDFSGIMKESILRLGKLFIHGIFFDVFLKESIDFLVSQAIIEN